MEKAGASRRPPMKREVGTNGEVDPVGSAVLLHEDDQIVPTSSATSLPNGEGEAESSAVANLAFGPPYQSRQTEACAHALEESQLASEEDPFGRPSCIDPENLNAVLNAADSGEMAQILSTLSDREQVPSVNAFLTAGVIEKLVNFFVTNEAEKQYSEKVFKNVHSILCALTNYTLTLEAMLEANIFPKLVNFLSSTTDIQKGNQIVTLLYDVIDGNPLHIPKLLDAGIVSVLLKFCTSVLPLTPASESDAKEDVAVTLLLTISGIIAGVSYFDTYLEKDNYTPLREVLAIVTNIISKQSWKEDEVHCLAVFQTILDAMSSITELAVSELIKVVLEFKELVDWVVALLSSSIEELRYPALYICVQIIAGESEASLGVLLPAGILEKLTTVLVGHKIIEGEYNTRKSLMCLAILFRVTRTVQGRKLVAKSDRLLGFIVEGLQQTQIRTLNSLAAVTLKEFIYLGSDPSHLRAVCRLGGRTAWKNLADVRTDLRDLASYCEFLLRRYDVHAG